MEADRAPLLNAAFARVWLGTFSIFATFGILVLTLPLYVKDELGHGSIGIGLAVGVASITAIIASPVSGRLSDRRGRRPLLIGGSLVVLGCYLALALGPTMPAILGIRLVAGAGEAAFVVALYTVATDLAPRDRQGEAMSLVTLASYLGLTIGPVAADLILGGDRFALVWIVAAALALVSLGTLVTLRETRPELDAPAPGGFLPPRGALLPGLMVLVGLLGFGGFAAFAAIYARDLGVGRPGLVFALFGGIIALVRLFGRRLPDAMGARRTLAYSFVALGVGLAIVGAWHSVAGLLVGTAVFAVGQALTYPAAVLLAMESASVAERSAVVGSVGAFVDVAIGLGALILGAVASVAGYRGAFLVASAVALSGLLVLTASRRSARIPAEEGAL